jgi:hypothetical protein
VLFEAFVAFAVNVTGAGPMADHVYVRVASPDPSAPKTDSKVLVAITGLGLAPAGVAMPKPD